MSGYIVIREAEPDLWVPHSGPYLSKDEATRKIQELASKPDAPRYGLAPQCGLFDQDIAA